MTFAKTCCLHFQGRRVSQECKQALIMVASLLFDPEVDGGTFFRNIRKQGIFQFSMSYSNAVPNLGESSVKFGYICKNRAQMFQVGPCTTYFLSDTVILFMLHLIVRHISTERKQNSDPVFRETLTGLQQVHRICNVLTFPPIRIIPVHLSGGSQKRVFLACHSLIIKIINIKNVLL